MINKKFTKNPYPPITAHLGLTPTAPVPQTVGTIFPPPPPPKSLILNELRQTMSYHLVGYSLFISPFCVFLLTNGPPGAAFRGAYPKIGQIRAGGRRIKKRLN
ncbi:hypothetical protein R80B4_00840 [Fibrobacteres bacterium R8-0-B4]